MDLVNRFLRYVRIDTQSAEDFTPIKIIDDRSNYNIVEPRGCYKPYCSDKNPTAFKKLTDSHR